LLHRRQPIRRRPLTRVCNGPIVRFGNNAQPVNDGRCCDRCYSETVVPEGVRRVLERDAKREGNG
jgi:hypothetical protein